MEVEQAMARLGELIALARGGEPASGEASSFGSPLGSAAEVASRFESLQLNARDSVEALDNGDYCAETLGQSPAQSTALSAGVRYRVVYSTSIFEADVHLEATLDAIAQGEEARVSDLVPSRLLLGDRREALVLSRGYPHVEHLGFYTTSPSLVAYLCEVFDAVWARALPVAEHRLDELSAFTPEQRDLLKYLVLGRTDASIARSLGVSTRTVQRQIQAIQHGLDARGRFQLGVRIGELLAQRGPHAHAKDRGAAAHGG